MDSIYLKFKLMVFLLVTSFTHSSIWKHHHYWPLKFVLQRMNIFHQTIQHLLIKLKYHLHQKKYHWNLLLLVQFYLYLFEILNVFQSFHQIEAKLVFDLLMRIHNLDFSQNLFYLLDSCYFRMEFHLCGHYQKHHPIIVQFFLFSFKLNLFDRWIFLARLFQ